MTAAIDGIKPGERQPLPLYKLAAVALGNAFEFYDFLTFSFFAIQIGETFFPGGSKSHGLLYALATFGVGFVTRPLGGFVIGRYGDRAGRKPAMILSFSLMGIGVLGVALTPSYAAIGVAAPILLVLFRLIQGFALGGEVGPSTAYLIEAAPPGRRGLYVSIQYVTQEVAVLTAGLAGYLLAHNLSPEALTEWGWRVAFLIGVAIVPVGLLLRRGLPETLEPAASNVEPFNPTGRHPDLDAPRTRLPVRLTALGLALLAYGAVGDYVLSYMSTYAQDSLGLPVDQALFAPVISALSGIAGDVWSGLLSDRLGRKPVMSVALATFLVLLVPGYWAMNAWREPWVVYLISASFLVIFSSFLIPALTSVAEMLPRAARSGTLALGYAIAMSFFGGTAQFVVAWLIQVLGTPLAPAWYLVGASLVGAVAVWLIPETAPVRTSAGAVEAVAVESA